jgi:hypothetical protein
VGKTVSTKYRYEGTSLSNRLVDAAEIIKSAPDEEVAYQHSFFCGLSLPRSEVDGLTYERTYKGASIEVRAGKLWNGYCWEQQSVPYGVIPRLIFAHINTEAVQRKSRFVDLDLWKRSAWSRAGVSQPFSKNK